MWLTGIQLERLKGHRGPVTPIALFLNSAWPELNDLLKV
jgi:hypothetical protein